MFFRCFFCTVRLSIFERFVFPKGSKFNRLVWDSLEIWKCGLYMKRVLTSDWVGKILNNVAIIGICLGCLFVACSRERVEDELIGRIRLNSLLIALYINSSVLIILSLFCYELLFLNVLVFNMFTNIIIFLIVFEMKLWKLKKSLRDEE